MDLLLPPGHDLPDWASPLEYGRAVVSTAIQNEHYHGSRALVSKSALDVFARSPAHYLHYLQTGDVDEDAPEPEAFLFGSAFHALILEPEEFERRYVRLPDFGDMRSSKNRALRDGWLEDRPGLTGLKESIWTHIHGMRESVFRHKRMRRILENGRPEVTCAAIDPVTGLPRKCRFDWVSEIEGLGLDAKSARDGSPRYWMREAMRRRYEVQDTYYSETGQLAGIDVSAMGFAVVEKTPPYVAELYTFGITERAFGEQQYMAELAELAECCETGRFRGYSDEAITEITYPPYAVASVANAT